MPTFDDVFTRVTLIGFGVPGDASYNQIKAILESAYKAPTDGNGIKDAWDDWYLSPLNTLTISYTIGQNRYIESESKIEIDPALAAS